MIKFYLKLQNKMLTKNLLYIVTVLVMFFNVLLRIFFSKFIQIPSLGNPGLVKVSISPTLLYTYCDVYLLLLFIILMFFFLGTDFNNSMEEIALAVGGSRSNKLMLRKLAALLSLYAVLYIITWINIYTAYYQLLQNTGTLISLKDIILSSLTTNFFVISLSLFLLFVSRDIAVSTTIVTAFYLVEEALWRCKITQENGILGHIYQYSDYTKGGLIRVKTFYILISIVMLFATYRISARKTNFRLNIRRKVL